MNQVKQLSLVKPGWWTKWNWFCAIRLFCSRCSGRIAQLGSQIVCKFDSSDISHDLRLMHHICDPDSKHRIKYFAQLQVIYQQHWIWSLTRQLDKGYTAFLSRMSLWLVLPETLDPTLTIPQILQILGSGFHTGHSDSLPGLWIEPQNEYCQPSSKYCSIWTY